MWSGLDHLNDSNASQEEDLYQVLGCNENSTIEQIITEYKIRALKLHPDKNIGNEAAVSQFQKLQEARNILSDSDKRKDYDQWRKCGISLTFLQWKHLQNRCQMTMHWATPKHDVMVEGCAKASRNEGLESKIDPINATGGQLGDIQWGRSCGQSWESDNRRGVYNQFRNYKI